MFRLNQSASSKYSQKRRLIWACAAAFIVLLGMVFALGYFHRKINAETENVLDRLTKELAANVTIGDYEIGIDSISLKDVVVFDNPPLKLDQVQMSFHLREGLTRPSLDSIDITTSLLELDLTQVRDLVETWMKKREKVNTSTKRKNPRLSWFRPERISVFAQQFKVIYHDSELNAESIATSLRLSQDSLDNTEIALDLTTKSLHINAPWLASDTVGPLQLNVSAKGQMQKGALSNATIEQSNITLSSPGIKINPLQASIVGNLKWSPSLAVDMAITIPETSCRSLVSLDPIQLTPALQSYDVEGGLGAKFTFQGHQQDEEKHWGLELQTLDFSCQLQPKEKDQVIDDIKQGRPIVSQFQRLSSHAPLYPISLPTEYTEFPPQLTRIFLASEDISFFDHKGLDSNAIAAALTRNLSTDKRALGASTITMQVAKNLFLSYDRHLGRKLQELFFTKYLEDQLSKQSILTLYLNLAEFGPGIYGVTNAARHFFNKSLDELSVLEITYLASVLPSPIKRYQYFCRGELSSSMRNLVDQKLEMLHRLNRIDDQSYELAQKQVLTFHRSTNKATPSCDPASEL